jgi:hypothetical protein
MAAETTGLSLEDTMMFLSLTGFPIVYCIRWFKCPARAEVTASDKIAIDFLRTLKNTMILNPDRLL